MRAPGPARPAVRRWCRRARFSCLLGLEESRPGSDILKTRPQSGGGIGRLTLVEQALELETGHEVLGGRHSQTAGGDEASRGRAGGYLDYLEAVIKHANSSLGLEKWDRMEDGATPR